MLPKTLPTGHNCLWTSKTGSSAAGTFSYSRKTRSYQFPTTPTQLPNGFKPTKRNKLHYTTPTHNNSRLTHLNKRVGKTTCTSQQNCKDNQRLSRSFSLKRVAARRRLVSGLSPSFLEGPPVGPGRPYPTFQSGWTPLFGGGLR